MAVVFAAGGCEIIAAPDASLLTGGGGATPVTTSSSSVDNASSQSGSGQGGQGGEGGMGCTPVDDQNACTEDVCENGMPVNNPLAAGESCGNDGAICDGNGNCVACLTAANCPGEDTTCQQRTCTMGVCGFDFADAGTVVPRQTVGDCKENVCDGAGAVVVQNADLDVPGDANDCTDDLCTAGVPSNPPRPENTPCGMDMALACNATGQCVGCGAPEECAGSDDECKTRTCENQICGVDFTAAGTDLTVQTDGDCLVEECDGNGNVVPTPDDEDLPDDDGNACTDEVCVDGTPEHPDLADGDPCSDGNGCTQADTCQAGICTAGAPVVCTALDQCHDVGTCDSATGTCSNPPSPDGDPCSDASACTQDDSCQAGVCVGSDPVICTPLDQCHDAGTCDAGTGMCSTPAKPDGDACNDGNACSQTDTCQAGVCDGQNPVVCTASDTCHDVGVCDTVTGTCSNPAKADGVSCSDGNACSQTDTCQAGVCSGQNPVVCGPPGVCHDQGTCNPGTGLCSDPSSPDGTACTSSGQPGTCTTGACNLTETEPNDVCPAANGPYTLSLGSPVTIFGAITNVLDRDRYAITLPFRGSVRVDVFTGTDPSTCAVVDTFVRLKGPSCTAELGNDDDDGAGNCSAIDPATDAFARNLAAGTYFVEVEEFQNNATIPQYGVRIALVSQCGNGTQEPGEACDDGNTTNGDACDNNCTVPACGNGLVGGAEACDDGNTANNDGCASICSVEVGFGCAGSPSVCTPVCGDGLIRGAEQCDDNNATAGDGCSATCQIETIAEVEPNGTCATATALGTPSGAVGIVAAGGITPVGDNDWFSFTVPAFADVRLETFDANGPLATCASFDSEIQLFAGDCTTAIGPVQDQGGIANCSRIDPTVLAYARHLAPGTYNVRVNDFDNNSTFAAYRLQVRFTALCGDGLTQGSEECDGGAGCTAACTFVPVCGDGSTQSGETCDDGNLVDGDGCSATCATEAGFACAGAPSACGGLCGNGGAPIVDETCDDGNTVGQDACDSGCVTETAITEVEPNDTTAQADVNASLTFTAGNYSLTGAISVNGDRDVTRFVLASPSVVHFETFSTPGECATGFTTALRLLDAAGTAVVPLDATSGIRSCSAQTVFLAAGTYYISMEESGNNATIASYILEAKIIPVAAVESEPNATNATANGLDRPQGFVAGGHQTPGDIDTYAVFVPAGKDLRIETIEGSTAETCESNGIDSRIRLFNAAGTELGNNDNQGRGNCSLIDGTGTGAADTFASNLAAGVYFIRVESSALAGTDQTSLFDYRLVVMIR